MSDHEETLRKLAVRDDAYVDRLLSGGRASEAASALDRKTMALVRIGALIALDATPPSYMAAIEEARAHGASCDEIAGCLVALWTVAAVRAPPLAWTTQREQHQLQRTMEEAKSREEVRDAMRKFADAHDDLGSGSDGAAWRALSPTSSLAACARDLFGDPVPSNFRGGIQWWFALGVPALFLALLWRKVRAVEVVT